jgi:hypothetical protein
MKKLFYIQKVSEFTLQSIGSEACTINILWLSDDVSRIVIDNLVWCPQIVASLPDDSRGII